MTIDRRGTHSPGRQAERSTTARSRRAATQGDRRASTNDERVAGIFERLSPSLGAFVGWMIATCTGALAAACTAFCPRTTSFGSHCRGDQPWARRLGRGDQLGPLRAVEATGLLQPPLDRVLPAKPRRQRLRGAPIKGLDLGGLLTALTQVAAISIEGAPLLEILRYGNFENISPSSSRSNRHVRRPADAIMVTLRDYLFRSWRWHRVGPPSFYRRVWRIERYGPCRWEEGIRFWGHSGRVAFLCPGSSKHRHHLTLSIHDWAGGRLVRPHG